MKNYKIFAAYKTNSVGVWYFISDEGAFKEGAPCKGFGSVKYAEGSVYTGDLFYDGKNFNKIGYGQQDFTKSNIGATVKAIGDKKYKFVGRYDYRKTDWIYGNGVVYYTDERGKPTHFKKGFYRGLDKIGEYKGKFNYDSLLDGYTADMEFDYDESAGIIENRWKTILYDIACVKLPYTLFIGDSYFELFSDPEVAGSNTYEKFFGSGYVNAGICGTRFADWLNWTDKLKNIAAPEKVVINLGFNDLHSGSSVNRVLADLKSFVSVLRGYFPDVKIYLISVVHAPNCINFLEKEIEFNKREARFAKNNGICAVEWNTLIDQSGQNCFYSDAIHPGEYGYGLFADFLKGFLG